MEERAGERRRSLNSACWSSLYLLQFLNLGRNIPMIWCFPQDSHTARSTLQRVPNLKQHAATIFPPLMIPEPQFFDSLQHENIFSFLISQPLFRYAMMKPVKFNGQLCNRTIKIQGVDPNRMLPRNLESRKTSGLQGAPQLLFFLRLLTTKSPCVSWGVHVESVKNCHWQDKLVVSLSSRRRREERGRGEEDLITSKNDDARGKIASVQLPFSSAAPLPALRCGARGTDTWCFARRMTLDLVPLFTSLQLQIRIRHRAQRSGCDVRGIFRQHTAG